MPGRSTWGFRVHRHLHHDDSGSVCVRYVSSVGGRRGPTVNRHGSNPSTPASTTSSTARGETPPGVPVKSKSPGWSVKSCFQGGGVAGRKGQRKKNSVQNENVRAVINYRERRRLHISDRSYRSSTDHTYHLHIIQIIYRPFKADKSIPGRVLSTRSSCCLVRPRTKKLHDLQQHTLPGFGSVLRRSWKSAQ